jgi:acetolactate synthase-1/2/3 large subunit
MVLKHINDYLKDYEDNYKITTGVGNHQMMTYQFIEGVNPKSIHSSGSLGVMGAGLPYAIGAQISNPNDLVIDIDGDSSFMMTMSDLKTIKEYNLPIKIAIMNDNKQMMVNIWEKLFFNERYTATINNNNPDFVKMAESFGIKAFVCSDPKDIQYITNEFLNYSGPSLCEYKIEGEICLPLVGPGKALDDMILYDEYHKNEKIKFDKSQVPS